MSNTPESAEQPADHRDEILAELRKNRRGYNIAAAVWRVDGLVGVFATIGAAYHTAERVAANEQPGSAAFWVALGGVAFTYMTTGRANHFSAQAAIYQSKLVDLDIQERLAPQPVLPPAAPEQTVDS
jgi:hypothetical protein